MSEDNLPPIVQDVTEEDTDILAQWKTRAKEINDVDELTAFIHELCHHYHHDYGTIVHAMVAVMLAASRVVDRSPQGGITGFQAGFVGWMLVREYMSVSKDGPLKLMDYENMLYPQYQEKFEKTISTGIAEYLKTRAQELLDENRDNDTPVDRRVWEHWNLVANGGVPFGYVVREDD